MRQLSKILIASIDAHASFFIFVQKQPFVSLLACSSCTTTHGGLLGTSIFVCAMELLSMHNASELVTQYLRIAVYGRRQQRLRGHLRQTSSCIDSPLDYVLLRGIADRAWPMSHCVAAHKAATWQAQAKGKEDRGLQPHDALRTS